MIPKRVIWDISAKSAAGGAHLAVCMGGPETWFELAELLDDEVFKDMLVQYGEFYFLPVVEEKKKISNGLLTGNGFVYPYMASALCGYAARETNNASLHIKYGKSYSFFGGQGQER